jgi:hypothetical protein
MISTTGTNKRVREVLKSVRDGTLIPKPDFQRRLVWTSKDKDRFIETVLKGYPFPEIYICNGEVDIDTGEGTQLLVDGLQRVSTLSEYFNGDRTISHNLAPPYAMLADHEKTAFLEYVVVVRDLGQLSKEEVVEVFKRLNSTQYTLREMEVNNAIYDGELKRFCEAVSEHEFFEQHRVFSASDRKRMGDVAFCLSIIGSMMRGYFTRDAEHEALLSRYNENFPEQADYRDRLDRVFGFIDECGFAESSRIWKKADFFTIVVELDYLFEKKLVDIDPVHFLERVQGFYDRMENPSDLNLETAAIYYRSALQASNDRNNRARRGVIISGIAIGEDEEGILSELRAKGLLRPNV